jgi:hypothetical protein
LFTALSTRRNCHKTLPLGSGTPPSRSQDCLLISLRPVQTLGAVFANATNAPVRFHSLWTKAMRRYRRMVSDWTATTTCPKERTPCWKSALAPLL